MFKLVRFSGLTSYAIFDILEQLNVFNIIPVEYIRSKKASIILNY